MSSDDRFLKEREIHKLKGRYCRYIDTKQWEYVRGLFLEDAMFSGFGSAPTGSDRDDFIAGVSSRLQNSVSVHHCHTPEIHFLSEIRARGIWVMEDYVEWPHESDLKEAAGAVGYRGYGFYEDEYLLTTEGWRIIYTRLSRLRIDALMPPRPPISQGWSIPNVNWLDED